MTTNQYVRHIGYHLREFFLRKLFISLFVNEKSLLYIPQKWKRTRTLLTCVGIWVFAPATVIGGGLFNSIFYKTVYKNSSIFGSEILHYVLYGEKEGRYASFKFNSIYYVAKYNLGCEAISPLLHFVLIGYQYTKQSSVSGFLPLIAQQKFSKEMCHKYFNLKSEEPYFQYIVLPTENLYTCKPNHFYELTLSPYKLKESSSAQIKIIPCQKSSYTRLSLPIVYGAKNSKFPSVKVGLDAFVAVCSNVLAIGGTTLLLDEKGTQYYDALIESRRFKESIFLSILSPYGYDPCFVTSFKTSLFLDKAIVLTYELDSNYYHHLIENVSRLMLLFEIENYLDYPIVMTKGLHENMYAPVKLLFPKNEIIFVDKLSAITIHKAIFCSQTSGLREQKKRFYKNSAIKHDSIRLRNMVLRLTIASRDMLTSYDKVYITRVGYMRCPYNEEKVISYLEERGFSIIDAGKISFSEQIRIFSTANTIIMSLGSAAANIIFCKPSCRILLLTVQGNEKFSHIWCSLAGVSSSKVYFSVSGKHPEKVTLQSINSRFTINIDHLEQFLSE